MISASGTRVIWPLADDFRSSMEGLPGAINVSYQAGYANATGLPVAPIPTAPRAGANALVPTVRPVRGVSGSKWLVRLARRIQRGLIIRTTRPSQIFNLCLASSLWSSRIFCDSATKPS
jgi:hypothetical protein